jgi:alkylation response protein AidB-like acyl-CoA dehydrogenase
VWHVVATIALPIVYSVYVGVAEAAREIALGQGRRRDDSETPELVGAMEVELTAARLALRSMIDAANGGRMGPEVTNQVLIGRALVGRAVLRTVDAAMEVARGAGFFRSLGLERLFRDAQGARYHPLRGAAQRRYTGRLALGLDVNG